MATPSPIRRAKDKENCRIFKGLAQNVAPDGPTRLCDVVKGDETWLYFYGIPCVSREGSDNF